MIKRKRKENKITATGGLHLATPTLPFAMVYDSMIKKKKKNMGKASNSVIAENIPFDQSLLILCSVHCCIFFIC